MGWRWSCYGPAYFIMNCAMKGWGAELASCHEVLAREQQRKTKPTDGNVSMRWQGCSITNVWSHCAQEQHRHAATHSSRLPSRMDLNSLRCGASPPKRDRNILQGPPPLGLIPLRLKTETALMSCIIGPTSGDSPPTRMGEGKEAVLLTALPQVHLVKLFKAALLFSLVWAFKCRAHLKSRTNESGKAERIVFP